MKIRISSDMQSTNGSIRKAMTIIGVASICMNAASAVSILGIEFPNVELLESDRTAGMPFVHEHPAKLMGMHTDD